MSFDHFVEKLQSLKDVAEEAHQRGMKNINIWHDHVLIELESKIIKVWYSGKIESQNTNKEEGEAK